MTKKPLRPKKDQISQNLKMIKIPLKPKNDQNTPETKNDQNTPETLKITKIHSKP